VIPPSGAWTSKEQPPLPQTRGSVGSPDPWGQTSRRHKRNSASGSRRQTGSMSSAVLANS